MGISVWFLGFSHSHVALSVHLLPLSAFLELGQFAAVEDLIFFLKVYLLQLFSQGGRREGNISSHPSTCLSHSRCFSKAIIS